MSETHCSDFQAAMSRRSLFRAGAAGLIPWLFAPSALSQVKVGEEKDHALVVLFLRGGADGLNMLVPYQEDAYYKARPSLAIAAPNDKRKTVRGEYLTDQFALHPSLKPLRKWFENEMFTFAHAVGSQDRTRSHFEAMSAMERGASTGHSGDPSGWIARYLMKTKSDSDTPLRAVAWADTLPDSLRGGMPPVLVQSISDFKLSVDPQFQESLESLYHASDPKNSIQKAGFNTLDALKKLEKIDPTSYKPANSATYPDNAVGKGFREVACLLKSSVGLEIASLEDTGWDTHVAQGSTEGIHANGLAAVAQSIDAFLTDLGPRARKVTVIVMTEFGRRVEENAGLGTDHGRASVMMAFGAVDGGKVIGDWPGMSAKDLDEVGDLKPVNDYRTVLNTLLGEKMPAIREVWG